MGAQYGLDLCAQPSIHYSILPMVWKRKNGGYCNGTTIAGINHISGTDSCGRQVVSAVAAETVAAASAVEVVVVVAAVVLVVIIVLGIVASSFVFCVVHRVRCSAPQCVYVCYAFCVCASCTLQRASLCVCVTLHVMST
jgi:ABC-type antimicrobial peptide transport system permease subunit